MVWTFTDVNRHPSILYEEPVGLLGAAILLYKGDIMATAEELQDKPGVTSGEVLKFFSTYRLSPLGAVEKVPGLVEDKGPYGQGSMGCGALAKSKDTH